MPNLGVIVMLGMMSSNKDTVEAIQGALNKELVALSLKDNVLHFEFKDTSKITLWDDGQSCCENRYMTTDDDLKSFVGAVFLDAELAEAPSIPGEYGEHEVQFLKIKTSKGVFTMETHNDHNGYYGGFLVRAAVVD